MKRTVALLLTLFMISSLSAVTVYGDSREGTILDLIEVYGTSELEKDNSLYIKFKQEEEAYAVYKKQIAFDEALSGLTTEAAQETENQLIRVSQDIQNVVDRNKAIEQEIYDEFEGDWSHLIQLDAQYKINLLEISQLEDSTRHFKYVQLEPVDYEMFNAVYSRLVDAKTAYYAAIPNVLLGDVLNVQRPFIANEYEISKGFNTYINEERFSKVYYELNRGTPVRSIFSGTVSGTGFSIESGYFIEIDHGYSFKSFYGNLNEIKVQVGQRVLQYDKLALTGSSAIEDIGTGLLFRFEFRGDYIDPEVLFKGRG